MNAVPKKRYPALKSPSGPVRGHRFVASPKRRAILLPMIRGIGERVAMPEMTGAELIARVADIYPDIPVILATGYAELPDGVGVGIQRLAKPFMQQQLNEALVTALEV